MNRKSIMKCMMSYLFYKSFLNSMLIHTTPGNCYKVCNMILCKPMVKINKMLRYIITCKYCFIGITTST